MLASQEATGAKDRVGDRAEILPCCGSRQGLFEDQSGIAALRSARAPTYEDPQRPECSPLGISRSCFVGPFAVVAQEVAKDSCLGHEGGLKEPEVSAEEWLRP